MVGSVVMEIGLSSFRSSIRVVHYHYYKFENNDKSFLSINTYVSEAPVYYFYTYNKCIRIL